MGQNFRKILFISFVLLFFISIPFVLLYTGGYRYNFKKNKFEKTGSLLVNLKTKGVDLHIEDKIYRNRERFRIKYLLPGEYSIQLKKDGHTLWQKKLEIQSGLSTFIKDVRLFRIPSPELIFQNVSAFYPLKETDKILYFAKDNAQSNWSAYLLDLLSSKKEKLFDIKELPQNVFISSDNERFVLETKTGYKTFDLARKSLSSRFLESALRLRWDQNNGSLLFVQKGKEIYKINFLFNTLSKIHASETTFNDFALSANYLYLVERFNLKQINLKTREIVSLPLERKDYQIKSVIDEKIYLESPQGKLQIFNLPLDNLSIPMLIVNAAGFELLGSNLLFYNDFELWTYDFSSEEKTLITRFGQSIRQAGWAGSANNIIFALEDKIKIIETDKRDARQIFDLTELPDIKNMYLTKRYSLYILEQKTGEAAGKLYKLEI